MTHSSTWLHRPWVKATENVLGHIAAIVLGFVMMVIGLGLGVTVIMLPVGVVVGLIGAAIFVGGLFARIAPRDDTGRPSSDR
jgi:hypothetical protein